VILSELLSGTSPFVADNLADVLAAVLTREPKRLTTAPPKLADVVIKAMPKDHEERRRDPRRSVLPRVPVSRWQGGDVPAVHQHGAVGAIDDVTVPSEPSSRLA
jgi:hypothetical protein